MSERDDGGPAFPYAFVQVGSEHKGGMTLRAWFAGQALAGLVANPETEEDVTFKTVAQVSVAMADAMIEALKDDA